jgi:hypothetical protein
VVVVSVHRGVGPGTRKTAEGRGSPGHLFGNSGGEILGAFYDPHELAQWIDPAPEPALEQRNIAVQIFGPSSSR